MNLELNEVIKKYGDIYALNGFSFSFREGIYGILGANGAGKSTLLNLIADNVKRDSGAILWNGTDILKHGGEFRRVLGYMPQEQGLYENMTAAVFLSYVAKLKGLSKKQAIKEIDMLLDVTNLTDVKHKRLSGFSGGMKQRVLLAQALLGDPQVLILDEPTAGLDPKERIRIRNFISALSRNRVVLLATHIVSDIESISSRIVLMKKGGLLKSSTAEELIESIRGKVKELPCSEDDLDEMQNKYRVSNVFHRGGQMWIRIIGDELPSGGETVREHISLDDVYLYYLGE